MDEEEYEELDSQFPLDLEKKDSLSSKLSLSLGKPLDLSGVKCIDDLEQQVCVAYYNHGGKDLQARIEEQQLENKFSKLRYIFSKISYPLICLVLFLSNFLIGLG